MATLYDVLRISTTATVQEVRTAFKQRALALHPDKGGTKEAFHLAMIALETLTDAIRRKRYDMHMEGRVHSTKESRPKNEKSCAAQPSHPQANERASSAKDKKKAKARGGVSKRKKRVVKEPTRGQKSAQKPSSGESKVHRLLRRVVSLLQKMPSAQRRSVIQQWLTHHEKLELERFIVANRPPAAPDGARCVAADSSASESTSESDSADEEMLCVADETCASSTPPCEAPLSLCDMDREMVLHDVDHGADVRCLGVAFGQDSDPEALGRGAALQERANDGLLALDDGRSTPLMDRDEHGDWDLDQDGEEDAFGLGSEESPGSTRQRQSVRGMSMWRSGTVTRYQACLCIGCFRMTAQYCRELSNALDHLIVLTAIKQTVKANASGSFDERIRHAVCHVLKEHAVASDIRIRYCIQLSKVFWVGPCRLSTPGTPDLELALRHVRDLLPACSGDAETAQYGIYRNGLLELESQWLDFKSKYIEVCVSSGRCRERLTNYLQTKESSQFPKRERQLEKWNLATMAREEGLQRKFARREKLSEKRNLQAMKREDRRSRKLSEAIERRLRRALESWRKQLTVQRRQQQRFAQRQRARELKEKRASTIREAARRLKQQRRAREERWRKMSRRDLTMEDLRSLGSHKEE